MQFERMLVTHRNSASFWAHHGKGMEKVVFNIMRQSQLV